MRMRLVSLLCLFVALTCHAQTVRYVSDTLEVPMRTGASTGHRILSMLKSGTRVEVLRADAESGYSEVNTGNTQGWILSRYLMDTPAARQILEPIELEKNKLKQQLNMLITRNKEVEISHEQLRETHERLSQELAQLRKTATNTLAIDEQNRLLQEKVVNLEKELQSLTDDQQQTWFLLGALVLLGGVLLGLIIPRLHSHRRRHWGDL